MATEITSPYPKRYDSLDTFFNITYSIQSGLGIFEYERYVQNIFGQIIQVNDRDEKLKDVGRISGVKLLLDQARNDEKPLFYIFDSRQDLLELGEVVFDFKKADFSETFEEYYDDVFTEPGILYLTNIEILPEFRKLDIGAHLIKDFYLNFISDCAFIATIPEARQFNDRYKLHPDSVMKYEQFERNEAAANEQVRKYFQRIGFEIVPRLTEDYMFINAQHQNLVFDRVILE